MTDVDGQINSRVHAKEVNEKYGEAKKLGAQQLYKNYKAWMVEKSPGKEIMSFKEWIKWAKEKGVVKNFSADAAEDNEKVTKIVNRTGKSVAVVMICLGLGFLALNFIKFNTVQQQPLQK